MKTLVSFLAFAPLLAGQITGPLPANSFAKRTYAQLSTPQAGAVAYCTNCQVSNPCASGGTGAFAYRTPAGWGCSALPPGSSALAALAAGSGIVLVDDGLTVTIEIDDTFVATLDSPDTFRVASCTDAGAANALACTPTPAITAYASEVLYLIKAANANTGAATVNFGGLGVKTIKKAAGGVTTDLAANDIRAGQLVALGWDGTNMQMLSLLGNAPAGGGGSAWYFHFFCPDTLNSGETGYCGGSGLNTNEAAAKLIVPLSGTLRNLRVISANYNNVDLVCTARINGSDTALTVTLAHDSAAGTLVSDTIHTAAVTALDVFTLKCVNGANTSAKISIQFTVN